MYRPNSEINCADVSDRLEEYLDRTLAASEREDVDSHLEDCRACSAELEIARQIDAGLSALSSEVCPPEVLGRVFDQTEVKHPTLTRVTSILRPMRVAVGTAAVIAIALLSGRVFQSTEPSEAEIQRALADVRLAFAYVTDAGRRTGEAVRTDIIADNIVNPMQEAVGSALPAESN